MDLESLLNWLRTYSGWEDTAAVESVGLISSGYEELWRKEDILGNLRLGCRYRFTLCRRAAGSREENTQWLVDFQSWVQQQSALGYAPSFGDDPALTRIQALQGSLKEGGQVYTATVTLLVDFVKAYVK